jgi:hypothetical protein
VNFDEDTSTYNFTIAGTNEDRTVIFDFSEALPLELEFPYEITEEPDPGDTLYLWWSEEPFGANPQHEELIGTSGTVSITRGDTGFFQWGVTTEPAGTTLASGAVGVTCAQVEASTPFSGYLAWPYLDFGLLGVDKMMEGFDIVADGTFSVSIGYSQRDTSLATDAYPIDGDTLTGSMVPMPLTAPSFQFRITFDPTQQWEWFATNMYCNNTGTG